MQRCLKCRAILPRSHAARVTKGHEIRRACSQFRLLSRVTLRNHERRRNCGEARRCDNSRQHASECIERYADWSGSGLLSATPAGDKRVRNSISCGGNGGWGLRHRPNRDRLWALGRLVALMRQMAICSERPDPGFRRLAKASVLRSARSSYGINRFLLRSSDGRLPQETCRSQ